MEKYCFSQYMTNRARALIMTAQVSTPSADQPFPDKYNAIWDTGATGTCIVEHVARKHNLPEINRIKINVVGGIRIVPVFLVCFVLPNNVRTPPLKVSAPDKIAGGDILIGMDIITNGDFAVSNVGGKTLFSFRMPSCKSVDFLHDQSLERLKQFRQACRNGRQVVVRSKMTQRDKKVKFVVAEKLVKSRTHVLVSLA